jgi:hypothetical protein
LIATFQNTGGARGEYEEGVERAEKRFEYGDWEPTNAFRGNISPGQTKEATIEKEMGRIQTFMYRMEGDNDTITVQPRNLSLGESVVNNGGVQMEIQNFEINETYFSDEGTRRSPYDSWGKNFLMMNYSAINTLDKKVTAGHAYDIEVLINGSDYQQTWHEDDIESYTPYKKTDERFNPLEPGETRTGHLTFTIPKHAQRENIVFHWNGKVFWNR